MDERLSDTSTWLQQRIDGRIAAGLGFTWLVLQQAIYALEPATNRPEPVYGIVLELAMWVLVGAMVIGLVAQRRLGLVASVGAAGFMTALAIACPVSGHHAFGPWWYGQMACVLMLLAASVIALRRSISTPEREPVSEHEHRLDGMAERGEPLTSAQGAELQ